MAEIRQVMVLTVASIAVFGMALLGGLGVNASTQAAVAMERKDSDGVPAAVKQEASIQATGNIVSAVFYFAGLVTFGILIMYSLKRR
jgi:hypothetical protein